MWAKRSPSITEQRRKAFIFFTKNTHTERERERERERRERRDGLGERAGKVLEFAVFKISFLTSLCCFSSLFASYFYIIQIV